MKRRVSRIIFLALTIIALVGCGGGGSTQPPKGRAIFTVFWPFRSRVIPVAAESVKITLSTKPERSQYLVRPDQTEVTFDEVPVGDYMATMTAYPMKDGTGTAQARATIPVKIVENAPVRLSVTTESAIDHLEIAPGSAALNLGEVQTFSVTAKDAQGNVVMTSPKTILWSSSDKQIIRVEASGAALAAGGGTAKITVQETESGKSASADGTVVVPLTLDVYKGKFASPFDLGVNTSGGKTDWVTEKDGFFECAYPAGQQWGAVFITVGKSTNGSGRQTLDLSQYDSVALEIKGASGGEHIRIGLKTDADFDDGREPTYGIYQMGTEWQTYKIPLSFFVREPDYPASRFSRIYIALELVFDQQETISFRNVRFEKPGGFEAIIQ